MQRPELFQGERGRHPCPSVSPVTAKSVNGPVNPLAKQGSAPVVHKSIKSYIPLLTRVSGYLDFFGTDHAFYLGNLIKSL